MVEINVKNKNTFRGKGVYVGRPNILSNPFKITKDQTRELAIQRYGQMIIHAVHVKKNPIFLHELRKLEAHLIDHQKINLICYCSPEPCHADIIKQMLLNKFHESYWFINEKCPTCGHGQYKIGVHNL